MGANEQLENGKTLVIWNDVDLVVNSQLTECERLGRLSGEKHNRNINE